ncbi:unnamed protein product [Brassica oleracea var. botrytis]|uniref:Uncharacterized protein n=1 Tax=Brassica oleracea TaxID=3712 RepID=A0A3P6EM49_BRAOL|nr:unnamed protein product [Brassica oleracea]
MDFSSDESAYKAYRKYGGNHGGSSTHNVPTLCKLLYSYISIKFYYCVLLALNMNLLTKLFINTQPRNRTGTLEKEKKSLPKKRKKIQTMEQYLSTASSVFSKNCKTLLQLSKANGDKSSNRRRIVGRGDTSFYEKSKLCVSRNWPDNKFITSEYSVNIPFRGKFNINLFRVVWRTDYVVGVLSLTTL